MSRELKLGFLGAGKMATALASGFVRAGRVESHQILASDLNPRAREEFQRIVRSPVTAINAEVAQAETVIVAVKPAQVAPVLHDVRGALGAGNLVVSIAAGITLQQLNQALPPDTRRARIMPNTPAVVGASATAVATGTPCTQDDAKWIHELFASVGVVVSLPESLMDSVTALSGSGPAYVYLMIEALSDGGVAEGLSRDIATRLAAQTVLGAARMVLETGDHPAVLRDQVTSPGGTTIEGLHALESGAVRASLIGAVRAAARKSRSLGSDQ